MARVLLGWELGAGNGHISRLLELADVLAARGHEPLFAAQQIGPFAAMWPTWQAPVWPRLLQPLAQRYPNPPQTMGDILAYLGLDDEAAITAMIWAWDRMFIALEPDVVVAEYAPILQIASRGRIPTIAFGTGFSLPPAQMANFPVLFGESAMFCEAALTSTLNKSLRKTNRASLEALPEMFAADENVVATFKELDPYQQWRCSPVAPPAINGHVSRSEGRGEEVFVYFNGKLDRPNAFWQSLVDSRLPIRVYDTILNANDKANLESAGIRVATAPVAFDTIAARSRLLISHGGLGFVSSGLLAGIPQIIIPFDGEKLLIADSLAGSAGCVRADFGGLRTPDFTAFLRAAWSDESIHAQARGASPAFQSRMTNKVEVQVAHVVERLA